MPEIVLTEEQSRIVATATTTVFIRGSNGASLGSIDPKEAEMIAEAKRRLAASGPYYYSSAQVLAQLEALHAERDRLGPFDAAHAREYLKRLEQEQPEKYGPKERS